MLRASLINGNWLNLDADLSKHIETLTDPGVIEGFLIENNNTLKPGKAWVKAIRSNGETIFVYVELKSDFSFSLTSGKLWIELSQESIDNWLLNAEDGTGIASIKTWPSVPSQNFLLLATATGGVVRLDRTVIPKVGQLDTRISQVEKKTTDVTTKLSKLEEAGTPSYLGITGIVGEKYTMQDTLFMQKAPTLANSILPLNVWDTNTNKEQHIQRISSGVASNQLKLKMDKVLSPTSSVVVEVRKGIKVDVNEKEAYWYGGWEVLATATLPYTKFSTEAQEITVDLNKSFQLPKGNLYSVVVMQQGGIVNANNYYRIYCDGTQWSEAFSAVAVNGTNRTRAKLMPYCVSDGFVDNIAAKSSSTEITIPQLETYLYNRNWADFVFEDENDLMLLFVAPTDMEIEAEITFRRNIWPQLGGLWNFYVNVNETKILEVYVSYWGNTGKKSNKIKVKKWDVISITKNANSFWASNPKVGIAMQNFYIRAFLTSISKQKTDEVIYAREQRAIGEVVKCTTFGRHIDGRRIDRNFFTSQLSSSVRTGNIPLGNAIWFMPFVAHDGKTYKIPIFWN